MNFFKLRRTKMLDEAVLDHKPQSVLTSLLIFYVVYFIGEVISKVIVSVPTIIWMFTYDGFFSIIKDYTNSAATGTPNETILIDFINEMVSNTPIWLTAVSLISFVGLLASAIFYCLKFEKRTLSSMGIRKKDAVKESFLGLIIGGVLVGLTVLFAVLTDSVSIKLQKFDFMIILFFVAFLIHAFSEVVFFFGYFTTTVARDYKLSVAITMGAVMFSLLHGVGEEINYILLLNSFLIGAILGIYVFKRGDVFGAFGILASWNFIGGCIFGTNASGIIKVPSIFEMTLNEDMKLANGLGVGLEGGLCSTVVLLIAFALIFFLKTKKGEESLSDATDFE